MQMRYVPVTLCSVGALALGFLLGRLGVGTPPPPPLAAVVAAPVVTPPAKAQVQPAGELRWSQVESPDYAAYIANLRRAGCPEQTIRDIIVADICSLYSQEWKRKHLASKPHYWDPEYGMGPIQSEAIQHAAAQVQAILRENVHQLLGVDLDRELEKFRAIGAVQLGDEFLLSDFLPPEKASAAAQALERHRKVARSIQSTGFLTAGAVAELRRARDILRRELAAFLGAEEVAQVEYRCSSLAQEIRDRMSGFDLTEIEFRELFRRGTLGQQDFEAAAAQVKAGQPLSPDEVLRLWSDSELSDSAVRGVLGTERYAEYQRSQDGRYQQLKGVGDANSLPSDWVKALYDNQRAAEEKAVLIRQDAQLDAEQRETMLRELRQTSQEQVRLWLGEELARKLQPVLGSPP